MGTQQNGRELVKVNIVHHIISKKGACNSFKGKIADLIISYFTLDKNNKLLFRA